MLFHSCKIDHFMWEITLLKWEQTNDSVDLLCNALMLETGIINSDALLPQNCKDHTDGPYCNKCLPGFYGDPTKGTSDDCQPCACPLNSPSNKSNKLTSFQSWESGSASVFLI